MGSNLAFASGSYVTGNSQMFKGVESFVKVSQTLAFDSFIGDFGANVNNTFSRFVASGSNISFTGSRVVLSSISSWKIEVGSDDAELVLDHGRNSFKNDSLEITLAKDAEPDADGWDVIAGAADTLRGWNSLSSVTLCGETAEYADGEWTSYSYRLFKEGNTLKLATIA